MRLAFSSVICLLLSLACATGAVAQIALEQGNVVYTVSVKTMRDIPFRTVIRQKYDYSCGSAALATLLRFQYGFDVDEATVFKAMYAVGDKAAIRKVGFSLLDMKKYLKSIGFDSDGYKLNMDELAQEDVPSITVITVGSYKHFTVIKGVNARYVLLGDPALGLRRVPRDEFVKAWTGIVFVIHAPSLPPPVYNAANEWRPWTQPPTEALLDHGAFADHNYPISQIFQVLQFTPLSPSNP